MTLETGMLIWTIIFTSTVVCLTIVLSNWCIKSPTKRKGKIFTSFLLVLLFLAFTFTSLYVLDFDNFTGDVESITITKLDEVYKSNIPNETFSCYYVSKLNDESIYEITVSNVARGDDNFIIKKEYEKGGISYELIVKDVENIPSLPRISN